MEESTVDALQFAALRARVQRERSGTFPVVSGSMEPVIRVGEMIEVQPLAGPPARFDIVVFWNGRNLICHYVQHRNFLPGPDGVDIVITRGLVAQADDEPVRIDRILGKVVSHSLGAWTKLRIVLGQIARSRR